MCFCHNFGWNCDIRWSFGRDSGTLHDFKHVGAGYSCQTVRLIHEICIIHKKYYEFFKGALQPRLINAHFPLLLLLFILLHCFIFSPPSITWPQDYIPVNAHTKMSGYHRQVRVSGAINQFVIWRRLDSYWSKRHLVVNPDVRKPWRCNELQMSWICIII